MKDKFTPRSETGEVSDYLWGAAAMQGHRYVHVSQHTVWPNRHSIPYRCVRVQATSSPFILVLGDRRPSHVLGVRAPCEWHCIEHIHGYAVQVFHGGRTRCRGA